MTKLLASPIEARLRIILTLSLVPRLLCRFFVLFRCRKFCCFLFNLVILGPFYLKDVYDPVAPMVESLFSGNAVSIAMYGLGGSGKEQSLRGFDGQPGMILKAYEQILDKKDQLGSRGQVLAADVIF